MTGGGDPVLRIDGLSKRYGRLPVLDGVALDVARGEVVALVGPSGVGKTTLFRCVTRLIDSDAGTVRLAGQPIHGLTGRRLALARRDIGVIFQQFNLVRRLSALDNVLIGRLGRVSTWRGMLGRFAHADRQRALAALDRVGLLSFAYRRSDTLSGGQQQRVAIARALAQESRLILADEPIASLDPAAAAAILALLRDLARERGIAVLCSLHQVDLAMQFADRVVGLRAGRLIADAAPEAFLGAAHDRVFGAAD